MRQSDKVDKLLDALYKARGSFKELERNGQNWYFKNKSTNKPHMFSTLDDIFNACKDALRAERIDVFYATSFEDGHQLLMTRLIHIDSGQWIESVTAIGDTKSNPQEIGSGITYMRRYHIQAMLNLEADIEDDGNIATGRTENRQPASKAQPAKIDYDYAGPPYRVFNADGTQAQQFTEGQTYLMRLKKILGKGEDADLINANKKEAMRVRKHINDLQDITDKAKESLLARIDDLPLGGKNG